MMVLIRATSQAVNKPKPAKCMWTPGRGCRACACACIQCDMCKVTVFEEDGDYSERQLDDAHTEDGNRAKAGVKALEYKKKSAW